MIRKDISMTGANVVENARILARSLAEEIGWTVEDYSEGAYVKKSGIPIYFVMRGYNNYIYIRLSNGTVEIRGSSDYNMFAAKQYRYTMWILKSSAGTIAFGVGDYVNAILKVPQQLTVVIAPNVNGQYTGFLPRYPLKPDTNSRDYEQWQYITEESTAVKTYDTGYAPSASYSGKSIIRRVADVEHKALFSDLYEVVTLANNYYKYKNSISLYANGTYYRLIGNKGYTKNDYYGAFAVPDIT